MAAQLRAVCRRDDDYAVAGEPVCDWDDTTARDALLDALVRDGLAVLAVLDDRDLPTPVVQAGELLATVIGRDTTADDDGVPHRARRRRRTGALHCGSRRAAWA